MSIFAPIRMPKPGVDAFMEGMTNSQRIFDSMSNRKYNEGRLAIAQQEAEKAKTLLPYMIQKYQDAHDMTPLQRQRLGAQIQSAQALAELHNTNAAFTRNYMNDSSGGAEGSGLPNAGQSGQNFSTPLPGGTPTDTTGMSRHDVVQIANRDQAAADQQYNAGNPNQQPGMSAPTIAVPQQQVAPVMPQATPSPAPINAESNIQPPTPGQPNAGAASSPSEEVVKKGDPRRYKYDKLAGMKIGGVNIPPVKTRIVDGVEYTTYPSGLETKMKVGPSNEEKQSQSAEAAGVREQKKTDVRESAKIQNSTKSLVKSAHLVKGLYDILKENPGLTGIGSGAARKFNLSSSKPLGEFDEQAGELQGEYAKATGARPGIGLVNWAKSVKPDIWKHENYNYGMLKSHAKKLKSTFDEEKSDWEIKNPGKKFPYELPDLSDVLEDKKQTSSSNAKKPPKVTKSHVTEENIRHTMKVNNLSRDEVMKRLKKKGLA